MALDQLVDMFLNWVLLMVELLLYSYDVELRVEDNVLFCKESQAERFMDVLAAEFWFLIAPEYFLAI